MPGFLREHSWSIVFSVGLHGLLIAAFAAVALITIHQALPTTNQPIRASEKGVSMPVA